MNNDSTWEIGDDLLVVRLTQGQEGRVTESCIPHGSEISYTGAPGAVLLQGSEWVRLDEAAVVAEGQPDAQGRYTKAVVQGSLPAFEWRVTYALIAPGLVTKELTLTPTTDGFLERLALASYTTEADYQVASTGLADIAAFLRKEDHGVFLSLDFPYSNITDESGIKQVTYPPFIPLSANKAYVGHTLTIGATRLSGVNRYGWDTGEVDAIDSYVQNRYPQRFDRPMFVTSCINNRYTMPQGNIIFYTYKDHPTLTFNKELMKREIELMPEIGIEYYHFFPGVFDWVEDDPDREVVREIVAHAKKHGVRVGDYSGTSSVFCPHYNEYSNTFNHPEWLMKDAAGNSGGYCFGCPEFTDHYIETAVSTAREYGFQIQCLDFLGIAPCTADHGHPVGSDSIYHQVAGLVRFLEAMNAVDPEMMLWSNSGNWVEFLPKLVWTNPNVYVTDPYIATPWQGLNMTRLLDDARREQMVELHYSRFIPMRNFTNCQYFFSQNSIVPDIRNYQYGALSTLAIVPNLSLAEIRPWMDRLPADKQEEVKAFYQKWTQFMKDHYGLWKKTYHPGDNPEPGAVEIYGHAEGDHGFIFLINPNYWNETVEITLDSSLGYSAEGACEVQELYPVEHFLLTSSGPQPAYGETLRVEIPAQQVRVLEVKPAPAKLDQPRVYGVPGSIEKQGEGYVLQTRGPQGTTHRFAVRTPDGTSLVTDAQVRDDMPKQARRLYAETPLRLLGQDGASTLFEVTFRRTQAPGELREWNVLAESASQGVQDIQLGFTSAASSRFPVAADAPGPLANFQGAYIENAFSEDQETWIDLGTKAEPAPGIEVVDAVAPDINPDLGEAVTGTEEAWWLSTGFHLPFMYTIGAEPALDEHTLLVLPMKDPARVKSIEAWVNGVPLDVQRYAFPRNRGLSTYWADLVGSGAHGGENTLVIHIAFHPGA